MQNIIPKALIIFVLPSAVLALEEIKTLNNKWSLLQNHTLFQSPVSTLQFEPSEVDFLRQIDHINMCIDPDWMPYDYVDDHGNYIGINADFHQLFSRLIGKEIKVVRTANWDESLEYIKQRKCDILSSATVTEERKQFLNFTHPFNNYPIVIATRTGELFITDIKGVLQQQFVAVKGFAAIDLLRQKYPDILILEVGDARTGLEMVAGGRAFGYLDTVATIGYQTQKHGILNIKISGLTGEHYAMSVAVRNDQPLLLTIFDKAVAALTEMDKLAILNKWIAIKYEQESDHALTKKILIVIGVLLLIFVLREYIVSKYKAKLVTLNKELERLSNTDTLTGIANRHLLNNTFEKELARAQRYHSKFSIILLDVDHFKSINDNFGHTEGDHVLKQIAHFIDTSIRVSDTAGRWGGEEFLILCPETDIFGAMDLAENIRQKIAQHDFDIPKKITVSLGVAEYRQNQCTESFMKRADDALYEAKKAGRNRVRASV